MKSATGSITGGVASCLTALLLGLPAGAQTPKQEDGSYLKTVEKHAAIIWGNNRYRSPIDLRSRPIARGSPTPRWRCAGGAR